MCRLTPIVLAAAAGSRRSILLHWLPVAAVFFLLAPSGFAQEPSFRTGVNLVLLDVSVTDAKGVPVEGLVRENFEVKEDGQGRELSGFALGFADISLALVVDYSGSMRPRQQTVIESVRNFVPLLRPGDETVLFSFNERPSRLFPLATVDSLEPMQWAGVLLAQLPTGQTALYDAVIMASKELERSLHERRVIVVLSDGEDTASTATLKNAIDELQSSNRLVYCVGLFRPGEPETDAGALRRLAESTGGIALFDDNGGRLSATLAEIMRDLRARYVLEFHSRGVPAGQSKVRKLAVTVRDRNGRRLKVRARDEYRAAGASFSGDATGPLQKPRR